MVTCPPRQERPRPPEPSVPAGTAWAPQGSASCSHHPRVRGPAYGRGGTQTSRPQQYPASYEVFIRSKGKSKPPPQTLRASQQTGRSQFPSFQGPSASCIRHAVCLCPADTGHSPPPGQLCLSTWTQGRRGGRRRGALCSESSARPPPGCTAFAVASSCCHIVTLSGRCP